MYPRTHRRRRTSRRGLRASTAIVSVIALPATSTAAHASDLLFETTQMGLPAADGGFAVYAWQFIGARFQLTGAATIDGVGGHLFGTPGGNGQIFAALIALTSLDDFPDSPDLSTPDVLAHTLFQPPSPSADVITPIGPINVPAGYYAVLFGSNLFGATGAGGAPDNNVPNEETALYNLAYKSGFGWDLIGNTGVRVTAYGTLVPEPATIGALAIAAPALVRHRRRRSDA